MFANVRLVTDKDTHTSRLYLNGNDISDNVRSVQVDISPVKYIPEVTIDLVASPFEYNGDADVKYDFTPDSVNEAIRIVKSELSKKGDAYEELIDRIYEAQSKAELNKTLSLAYANSLDDYAESMEKCSKYTASFIAHRLIGLEEPL